MRVAAVILAAGEASRFGSAKPLALFRGETLVARAIRAALEAGCESVVVIKGAHDLGDACAGAEVVHNAQWHRGMGTSIRAAVEHLHTRAVDRLLLLACDQPLVTADSLLRLLNAASFPAAAEYGTIGIPAVFNRAQWPALRALRDDAGAKQILLACAARRVPMPEAATDVDTPADLAELQRRNEAES